MFQRVGILGHPMRPGTAQLCGTIEDYFRTRGLEVWSRSTWDAASVSELVAQSGMVVAIGGDGAMLRAAAHLSSDRPLVLSEGATIEVIVSPKTNAGIVLNIDGEGLPPLEEGDSIAVHASDYQSRFIRLRNRNYFYPPLLDRMAPRMP